MTIPDTDVTLNPSFALTVTRTQHLKNAEVVSFRDFGAVGDGIADDTLAIRAACAYSATSGALIEQNDGVFLINKFDETLSDGSVCAIHIGGSLKIAGTAIIKTNTTTNSYHVFAYDSGTLAADISIKGLRFEGPTRNRAFFAVYKSLLNSLDLTIDTKYQAIIIQSYIKTSIRVNGNRLGLATTATTPISTTLTVTLPSDSTYTPFYEVCDNYVVGGTEFNTSGLYVIHYMPAGGKCEGNVAYNIGQANSEGFDIDALGRFASFSRNKAIYCGFEFKVSTTGIEYSRDIQFNDNMSYGSLVGAAFSIRSSCSARGNIAYNPGGWGLWIGAGTLDDPLLNQLVVDISGFTIVWAGVSWNGAVRIENIFKKLSITGLRVVIDATYANNNPTKKIACSSGGLVNIKGNFNGLDLIDSYLGKCENPQILVRTATPEGRVKNLRILTSTFEDCDVACINVSQCDNLTIFEPVFPANIGDRPVRHAASNGIYLTSNNASLIDTYFISSTTIAAILNNFGKVAKGSAGYPNNGDLYRIGVVVQNTYDGTFWIKTAASATSWSYLSGVITSSTANLSATTNDINTAGKYVGKDVYNTTNNKKYYSIGTAATSAWRPYDAYTGGDIAPV